MADGLTSADFRTHCATCEGAITSSFVTDKGWVHVFIADWIDNLHEATLANAALEAGGAK